MAFTGARLATSEPQLRHPPRAQRSAEAVNTELQDYQRIRRRDGVMRWGVYYDVENPGVYLEDFIVASWAEHSRQHDRCNVADRRFEERVLSLVLESPKTRHFLYANRAERVPPVRETKRRPSDSSSGFEPSG